MKFLKIFDELGDLKNYKFHLAKQSGDTKPLDSFIRDEWKGWHTEKKTDRFSKKYVCSFAHIGGDRFLFAGIFEIKDRSGKEYEVEYSKIHEELIGRVVIKFDAPRTAEIHSDTFINNPKLEVVEIYPEKYTKESFPGIQEINHSFREMEFIFKKEYSDWKNALKNQKGIYLLTDNLTGKHYVGSASGVDGIWQRWSNYIYDAHGGNVELKKLYDEKGRDYFIKNFKFSILETVGSNFSEDDINKKESLWKEKLITREWGYNSN